MGGGHWTVSDYTSRISAKKAAGKPVFDYDYDMRRTRPRIASTVHESLDPKALNSLDKNVREAFDSDDHPDSLPIAVIFDVTGSMGGIPLVLQKKLPQLHGLLMRKGYVEHPQILFGGVGDAYSDAVPLQVGQFESDNRGDEQLEKMVLEGGGGGGNHESYELAAYYLARHADLDSIKKRGKKGYLFFIGDERVYNTIDRQQVERLIGDNLQQNLSTAEIFEELKQKFEVFYLFAAQGSYQPEGVLYKRSDGHGYYDDSHNVCYWRDLLGQNAIVLEDAEAVCETIATTLGVMEGTVNLDEGLTLLKTDFGADNHTIKSVGKALAEVSAGTNVGAMVATASGDLPSTPGNPGGATRL